MLRRWSSRDSIVSEVSARKRPFPTVLSLALACVAWHSSIVSALSARERPAKGLLLSRLARLRWGIATCGGGLEPGCASPTLLLLDDVPAPDQRLFSMLQVVSAPLSCAEQPFDVLPLKKICFKIANEGQIVRANFDALEEAAAVSQRLKQKELKPA